MADFGTLGEWCAAQQNDCNREFEVVVNTGRSSQPGQISLFDPFETLGLFPILSDLIYSS
jgi:hypothetical protein